jgi:hypothetical protein
MSSYHSDSTRRPHYSRRQFSQMFAAVASFAFTGKLHAQSRSGPSMLLGAHDPFCGLDILRIRYAAGRRPSADMAGNALSWLICGEDDFAQKSLMEMRNGALPAPGSRAWPTYANWAHSIGSMSILPSKSP